MKQSIVDALGLDGGVFDQDLTNTDHEQIDDDGVGLEDSDISSIDIDEIRHALDQVKEFKIKLSEIPDLHNRKEQLSKLATTAEKKFEQVLNIALNSDPRFAAGMIQAAATILKAALDAHTRIIATDVKLIDMQIKKDKMEFDINNKMNPVAPSVEKPVDDAVVDMSDRNAVIEKLKQKKTK